MKKVIFFTLLFTFWLFNNVYAENIFDVINNNDIESVRVLLNKLNPEVNIKDTYGNTPMHKAAEKGHKDIAELLIQKHANVNVEGKYGNTPLHWAAHNNHKDVAELLIEGRANVNVKGKYGNTPLHYAVYNGNLKIAKPLINSGANVNIKNKGGNAPLHTAAEQGHLDIVELLIENGVDVNVKNNFGYTPLYYAAIYGCQDIAKLLTAAPSLVLQLEQDEDKADKKYKKVKYKLNLNKLNSEKKEPCEPMFDLLMGKTDDKSNNKKVAPFLCLELIADKLFETPFENSIELHNAKAFLKQCFIKKDIVNTENELKYPGAQCFIGALYKNHLSKLKNYIIIKNDEDQTAIEITDNENIKKHLKDIQDAESYTNLKKELKNKVEYNYTKTIYPEGLQVALPLMSLELLYEKSQLMGVN